MPLKEFRVQFYETKGFTSFAFKLLKSWSGLDTVADGSWLREDEGPAREDGGPDGRKDGGPDGRDDEGAGEVSRPAAINNKIIHLMETRSWATFELIYKLIL